MGIKVEKNFISIVDSHRYGVNVEGIEFFGAISGGLWVTLS